MRVKIRVYWILDYLIYPIFYHFVGGYGRIEKDTVDNDMSIGGGLWIKELKCQKRI